MFKILEDGLGNYIKLSSGKVFPLGTLSTIPQKQEGNNPMFNKPIDYSMPFNGFCDCDECQPYKTKKARTDVVATGATSLVVNNQDSGATLEEERRQFLGRRADDIRYSHQKELRKTFFLDEPDGPKTPQELTDRLKAGEYTVNPKMIEEFEEGDYFYWRDAFSWRTPETQADYKGYKIAADVLEKAFNDVIDQLRIFKSKDGLTVLNAFKEWKYVAA